jgi:hypothetical protein
VKLRPVVPADLPADLRRSVGLTERGVDISGKQQTKTRKALEYFAKIARAEQA